MTGYIGLNLGCGVNKLEGYINVDIRPEVLPDIVWDLEEFPYPWADNFADEILLDNTIEHISYRKHNRIYVELYRILRPGGSLKVITPDVEALYNEFIYNGKGGYNHSRFEHFLFGGHEHEYDFHKAGYTIELLLKRLTDAGFVIVFIVTGIRAKVIKPW